MKKFLFLITVALIALAIVYRDRLFLRDPLGSLERNGTPVSDARIFINYSNDVLVQEDRGRQMLLVQHYNRLPGSPSGLTCLQGMLCLTPSDQAVPGAADSAKQADMSDREVSFTDALGSRVHVRIR
ncbi:MAG: hypothetical protein NVSMB3_08770 [Acidobacteriaceae bacterium]